MSLLANLPKRGILERVEPDSECSVRALKILNPCGCMIDLNASVARRGQAIRCSTQYRTTRYVASFPVRVRAVS